MPSSFSPNLRLELIANGEQAGNWGATTNTNLGTLLESSIAGFQTVSVIAADQALTIANGAADQSRNAMLRLTTTTGAAFNVYAPPSSKQYTVFNDSAHAATIFNSTNPGNTTAAGTGITIPAGRTLVVFTDGTNFRTVDVVGLTGVLAVANGGTGATTAAGARTNLGTVNDPGSNGILVRTTANTTTPRTIAVSGTGLSVTNGDGVAGNPTVTSNATSANTNSTIVARDASGNFSAGTITAALSGNVTGNVTGNASTATALQNARTIGGVSFNGTANIDLPGVNTTGNQNTTGSAATLTTIRTLWGQNFNGSANVTGALSSVTTLAMSGQLTNTVATGTAPLVISSTTRVANLSVANAGTADTLTTARLIGGVSFNGSANINLPGVNTVGNQNTTGSAATLTTARTINGVSFNGSANITLPTVNTSGNQTIDGVKTFSSPITGNLNGNLTAAAPTANTAAFGTNSTQVATTAFVQAALQALHPIGSIYINATNAANPATYFGFGTWVAFGAGRVPVGFDATDPLFDSAEETGGSKNAIVVSHTHTVTDPGHTHPISYSGNLLYSGGGGNPGTFWGGAANQSTNSATTGVTIDSAGSSGTNANLQPYITVYMWKRTA